MEPQTCVVIEMELVPYNSVLLIMNDIIIISLRKNLKIKTLLELRMECIILKTITIFQ